MLTFIPAWQLYYWMWCLNIILAAVFARGCSAHTYKAVLGLEITYRTEGLREQSWQVQAAELRILLTDICGSTGNYTQNMTFAKHES